MNNKNLTQHEELNDILFSAEIKNTGDHFSGTRFSDDLKKCVYLGLAGAFAQKITVSNVFTNHINLYHS
mgnify:CR=1 FL=1